MPALTIISGGQTGADRAALDVAEELGLETRGWVPLGRRDELGVIPERYTGLVECESAEWSVRTRLNVRDADGTVVLSHGAPSGGTRVAAEDAGRRGTLLSLDLDAMSIEDAATRLRAWIETRGIRTLNVAGARASEDPAIEEATRRVLRRALRGLGAVGGADVAATP